MGIPTSDDFHRVFITVVALNINFPLIGGVGHEAIFPTRAKHLQFIGNIAVHQGLSGGELDAKFSAPVVNGFHIYHGSQLVDQPVALVKDAVGIADAVNGIGGNLAIEVCDGHGNLVDAGHVLSDGDIHFLLDVTDAGHGVAHHIAQSISKGNKAFTRGHVVGPERKVLPCAKKFAEQGVDALTIGLVEKVFQRGHDGVMLVPAGRIGGLRYKGLDQKGVIVAQYLLGLDAKGLFSGAIVESASFALVNILAGVAFGIGIGDIVAGDGDPCLRGIKARLPDIEKSVEHGLQPPGQDGRLRHTCSAHTATPTVGIARCGRKLTGDGLEVAAALVKQGQ